MQPCRRCSERLGGGVGGGGWQDSRLSSVHAGPTVWAVGVIADLLFSDLGTFFFFLFFEGKEKIQEGRRLLFKIKSTFLLFEGVNYTNSRSSGEGSLFVTL